MAFKVEYNIEKEKKGNEVEVALLFVNLKFQKNNNVPTQFHLNLKLEFFL